MERGETLILCALVQSVGHLCLISLGLLRPQIKCFFVSAHLKRADPEQSQSTSLGKARKLSTPKRIEILPEWESFPLPVHALHWVCCRIENGEVLFRGSSRTYSCNEQHCNLNWIYVVRIVSSSPA